MKVKQYIKGKSDAKAQVLSAQKEARAAMGKRAAKKMITTPARSNTGDAHE